MKVQQIVLQVIQTNDLFKLANSGKRMVLTIGVNETYHLAHVRCLNDLLQAIEQEPTKGIINSILNTEVETLNDNWFDYLDTNGKAITETLYLALDIIE